MKQQHYYAIMHKGNQDLDLIKLADRIVSWTEGNN